MRTGGTLEDMQSVGEREVCGLSSQLELIFASYVTAWLPSQHAEFVDTGSYGSYGSLFQNS